ncbi:WD40 repeat-like protein [Peniophora sp. CONT]|nr:WD40 repeat-like protein [Peniophora sp. CONT]
MSALLGATTNEARASRIFPDTAAAAKGRLKFHLESCSGIPLQTTKPRFYYVALSVDSLTGEGCKAQSEQAQDTAAEGVVKWDGDLYLEYVEQSSMVRIRVYAVHRIKDQVVCESHFRVHALLEANKVSLPVVKAKDDGDSCTLRLLVTEVTDDGRAEMEHVVSSVVAPMSTRTDALLNRLPSAALSIDESSTTVLGRWGHLLNNIRDLADIIKAVSDIHPYTSIAWSVMSAGYEIAKRQSERDEAVTKLIDALYSAYDVVLSTENLSISETSRKIVMTLIQQTINCGHFINSYLKRGFWARAVTGTVSSTDKDIAEFHAQFRELRTNLTTHSVHVILGNTERIADSVELSNMQYTRTARWRSGKRCLPGTRVKLISEILHWVHSSDETDPRMLLMTGVAGVGKSSVAHTIASSLDDILRLAASYCFDRNDAEHHRPNLLFPTIARHLADTYPQFKRALVHSNTAATFGTSDLDDQFENLLRKPLANLTLAGPLVIVIDALDESANPWDRRHMLTLLANQFTKLPPNFRIILTSRPEDDVLSIFENKEHIRCMSMAVAKTRDIQAFVASKLVDANNEVLPVFTPSDHLELAHKAEGLFQWADIACSTIVKGRNPNLRPTRRQMRESFERFVMLSSGTLDALYEDVLSRLLPEPSDEESILLRILGFIVTSREPLNATALFELLRLSDEDRETCEIMLRCLGALLTGVSGTNQPIRILHSSFRDYLLANNHDGRFYVKPETLHLDVVFGCLRALNDGLHFNICGLESSYDANTDVPDLQRRIEDNVPLSLSYAAQSWGHHLASQPSIWSDDIERELLVLLHEKFLFWLELLSVLDAVNTASPALEAAEERVKMLEIRILAEDCRRFVRSFGIPISQSAPHVYLSAYPFAPRTALVHEQLYSPSVNRLPRLSGIPTAWSSTVMVINTGHPVMLVAVSPDDRRLASSRIDGTICIWDAETGTAVGDPLVGHKGSVCSLAFSPDGINVASGSKDRTVCIWDTQENVLMHSPLIGHAALVGSVTYSPDGGIIASGSQDCTVRLWDVRTGTPLCPPLECHPESIEAVAFSRSSHQIIICTSSLTVYVWTLATGEWEVVPLAAGSYRGGPVAFSSDYSLVASYMTNQTMCIFSASSGIVVGAPLEYYHNMSISGVTFSPDSRLLGTGSNDGTVHVWDLQRNTSAGEVLRGHAGPVHSVAFFRDGHRIVSSSSDSTIRIWDTKIRTSAPEPVKDHVGRVHCVALSRDGLYIAMSVEGRKIQIRDARTGVLMQDIKSCHKDRISVLAFTPDGRQIASGSRDHTVCIYDTGSCALVCTLHAHKAKVIGVAFSPDGSRMVTGSLDSTVRVWDTKAKTLIREGGCFTGVLCVTFSPDGTRLALCRLNSRYVEIWDARTLEPILEDSIGHVTTVRCVAFSQDGCKIATGSSDKSVRVWDAQTGRQIGTPLKGHLGDVESVSISPDGRFIASGSRDGTLRLWNMSTYKMVKTFKDHKKTVFFVAFTSDSQQVISGAEDNAVRSWDIGEASKTTRMHTFGPDVSLAMKGYPCEDVAPWYSLAGDGWLKDFSHSPSRLLLWIPPEMRGRLCMPPLSLSISSEPLHSLDLSNFAHGVRWTECWKGDAVA